MKVEGYLFVFYTVFLVLAAGIYGWLSEDPAGTTMILLSGGLALIVAFYLVFTARRMEARPEDRPDAEVSEGSGEVGFFPPHSWWPLFLAASITLVAVGTIFGVWLFLIGFGFVLVTTAGLLFEYYLGINRSQGQTLQALEAMGEKPTSPHKFLGD